MTTMDQIHHIRELFYSQGKNISEIAKETGLNWKTVQKYVDKQDFNLPKPEAPKVSVSKLDQYKEVIDYWLTEDRKAPRKQRHTARRVYQRPVALAFRPRETAYSSRSGRKPRLL